jgi:hypothetical protein
MTILKYTCFCLLFLFLQTQNIHSGEKSVAFLGESYSSENDETGINEEILSRLFSLIQKQSPSAVVFTGNMTLGLQKNANEVPPKETKPPEMQPSPLLEAIDRTQWPRPGYSFNPLAFQKAFDRFVALKNESLGKNVPFYPILGEHESYGPAVSEIVQKAFNIESQVPSFVSPLAYTFSIDKCLFIVFSVAQFSQNGQGATHSELTLPLIKWLNGILEEKSKNFDYIFVAGNQPAFSTTGVTANFQGLDVHSSQRDLFWRILMKYKVTAYFCAQEHLYDRTNRHGVWQIISGGAGAPLYKRDFDKAFYHYVRLILPHQNQLLPKIQVFDIQGNLIDEIELAPSHYPVYQLRIS